MRGGKHRWVEPLDVERAENVTATPFDSLSESQQETFFEMQERQVKEEYPMPEFPDYVEYNGTVWALAECNL